MRALALLLAAALTAPFAATLAVAAQGSDDEHGGAPAESAGADGKSPDAPRAPSGGRGSDRDAHGPEVRDACGELRGPDRAACAQNATGRRLEDERGRASFERARDEMLRAAPDDRLGGFVFANGSWQGKFVSFTWDAPNTTLRGYTVGGVRVLDALRFANASGNPAIGIQAHGRVVQLEVGDAKVLLHDNPSGVLAGSAPQDGALRLQLSPGLNVSEGDGNVFLAGPGGFTGALHGDGLALDNGTVTAPQHVTFVAREDNVALPAVANGHRSDIEDAKERGHVGAEVTVTGPGDADIDAEVLDAPLALNVTHTGRGVHVAFNATGIGPRTIVLNIAAGLLQGERFNVTYFDEADGLLKQVPIVEADSLADVLDPTDDSTPEFWVVHDRDGAQVLVSVTHFSSHAFEVQGALEELPPSILAGALGAVLFVAVAGAGLFARRKR